MLDAQSKHWAELYASWSFSDIRREYARMKLDDDPLWRIVDNRGWSLADTYPPFLCVPASLDDALLVDAAAWRSKNRLPVVTYRHGLTGAVLTRSAQPLVGIQKKFSTADVALLSAYRSASGDEAFAPQCNRQMMSASITPDSFSFTKGESGDPPDFSALPKRFTILDARGVLAATANRAAGKGTEDINHYPYTELIYCNIGNIHTMRASLFATTDLLLPGGYSESESGILGKLDETGWLQHLQLLLQAALMGAEQLHSRHTSVLVHCSDGWDRTAQICTLIQLLLDPYYRTIKGLAALIEKDWCAFGFKFAHRLGVGADLSQDTQERSPIFLQLLHAIWEVMRQIPRAFEFTQVLACPLALCLPFSVCLAFSLCLFLSRSLRLGSPLLSSSKTNAPTLHSIPFFFSFLLFSSLLFSSLLPSSTPLITHHLQELLIFLADQSTASAFGNFFGNCYRERHDELRTTERTFSIWGYVLQHRKRFENPAFEPSQTPIWPSASLKVLQIWPRFFYRWTPEVARIYKNAEGWLNTVDLNFQSEA
jgi:hypothetical protein